MNRLGLGRLEAFGLGSLAYAPPSDVLLPAFPQVVRPGTPPTHRTREATVGPVRVSGVSHQGRAFAEKPGTASVGRVGQPSSSRAFDSVGYRWRVPHSLIPDVLLESGRTRAVLARTDAILLRRAADAPVNRVGESTIIRPAGDDT